MSEKFWYVIYTKPRSEKKLKSEIEDMNIETFLPCINTKKQWSDRLKYIETPLFPSYLFVKINYKEDSLNILKRANSVAFLFNEGKPAILEESEIELIKLFILEYPNKIKLEELEKIKIGNEVEIKKGVFAGRKGIIEKIKNKAFLILKINSLNKILKVEIKIQDLGLESI